jgi:hypothetical protein
MLRPTGITYGAPVYTMCELCFYSNISSSGIPFSNRRNLDIHSTAHFSAENPMEFTRGTSKISPSCHVYILPFVFALILLVPQKAKNVRFNTKLGMYGKL